MMDPTLKVLLADGDEDHFISIRGLLNEIGDLRFEIDWAPTYEAAEEHVCQNQHDVYLFDLVLGNRSGLDLLEMASKMGCPVPVIVLAGDAAEDGEREAIRAGASDYLVKGQFDGRLLARSIRYSIERKRAETALRLSEERYRHLLENSNDLVFAHDWQGNLTAANSATEQVTGYSGSELADMNLSDLLTAESLLLVEEMKVRKMAGEPTGTYEVGIQSRNNGVMAVEVNTRVIRDGQKPVEFQSIGRDITERKAAEEKLREYAREIEAKNAELSAAQGATPGKKPRKRSS